MAHSFDQARITVLRGSDTAWPDFPAWGWPDAIIDVCFESVEAHDRELGQFANRVLTAEFDALILLTGAGTERILRRCQTLVPGSRLLPGLADIETIIATSQAAQVLRQNAIEPDLIVADPPESRLPGSAWRELLRAVDRHGPLSHRLIAIEQTAVELALRTGLEARGARTEALVPARLALTAESPGNPVAEADPLGHPAADCIVVLDPLAAWAWAGLRRAGEDPWGKRGVDRPLVFAVGPDTVEVLTHHRLPCDHAVAEIDELASIEKMARPFEIHSQRQRKIRMTLSGPASNASDPQAPWHQNPFMKACRGEPTDVTPVWMMRQAGRYMAEYRAVRDKVSFLDLCHNPSLCSEVMCTAVERLGVDAAIIFSDLLPILVPMGCDLEFVKGDGPVIHNPVRTTADIDRIQALESNAPVQFVMDTVSQTRNDLPADMPLIGFAGAPFTLASYMIEGGASRNYAHTKQIMFGDRGAWDALMEKLTRSITGYLIGQADAGAQCVQLFDSWAGCLSDDDYRMYVLPWVQKIVAEVAPIVPVINFATGNPALLPLLAETEAAVIGVDWRIRLDDAWQQVGFDRGVQGNLDPTVLLTDTRVIRQRVQQVLDQAGNRPGHIFNLGHGILPTTPVDHAIALVDAVHELSSR